MNTTNTTSPATTSPAQETAEGAATPAAPPSATSPAADDRHATTRPIEPVSPSARRVARAILSTLTPDAAACVLCALAGLASAIINAASTLRHATGEGARLAASTMLDAAAGDAFDGLTVDGEDCGVAAYAVCASWWFSTPCDVVASFWRNDGARANVEAQARGVLAEVDAMRREVSQSEPSAAVRAVEGLPFPAVRLADGSTLVNPAAVRPLARGGEELPEGVERVEARGRSWRKVAAPGWVAPAVLASVARGDAGSIPAAPGGIDNVREHFAASKLETALPSVDSLAPRVLRVEAPPFAAKSLTAAVGHVLYLTPSTAEGYGDIASGLAGLVSGDSDATDAAGLVSGLAQVATMHAAVAVEAREVCDARTHLNDALDALDAARRVARFTLDALDAAPGEALAPDVKVCA